MSELRYQFLPNRPLDRTDVMVLPVPHELTVSYRLGTRNGPEAILAATEQLEYYEEDGHWSPFKHMGVTVLSPTEKRLYEKDEDFHVRLREAVADLPRAPLLLALGGEHSITPPLVGARMPEPGTVVLIDAHADLRRTFEGSENSHACPMYHVREAGHRIVMAGIRSLFEEEAERIAGDDGIDCFRDRSIQRGDGWTRLMETLGGLSGPVYLTIDMDGFNPAEVAGVGTPQPGGLSWYQVLEIVDAVVGNANVDLRGADVVETVPEPNCVTDMLGAKLTQKIISAWGLRNGFRERERTGSQTEVEYE